MTFTICQTDIPKISTGQTKILSIRELFRRPVEYHLQRVQTDELQRQNVASIGSEQELRALSHLPGNSNRASQYNRRPTKEDRLLPQFQAFPGRGLAFQVERRRPGQIQPAQRRPPRLAAQRRRTPHKSHRRLQLRQWQQPQKARPNHLPVKPQREPHRGGFNRQDQSSPPHHRRPLPLSSARQPRQGRRLRVHRVLHQLRAPVHEPREHPRDPQQFPVAAPSLPVGKRQPHLLQPAGEYQMASAPVGNHQSRLCSH